MTPEQRFVEGWKKAAPVLEECRLQKLRDMSSDSGAVMLGAGGRKEERFYSHGLARWQTWMVRWRLLETIAASNEAAKHG